MTFSFDGPTRLPPVVKRAWKTRLGMIIFPVGVILGAEALLEEVPKEVLGRFCKIF